MATRGAKGRGTNSTFNSRNFNNILEYGFNGNYWKAVEKLDSKDKSGGEIIDIGPKKIFRHPTKASRAARFAPNLALNDNSHRQRFSESNDDDANKDDSKKTNKDDGEKSNKDDASESSSSIESDKSESSSKYPNAPSDGKLKKDDKNGKRVLKPSFPLPCQPIKLIRDEKTAQKIEIRRSLHEMFLAQDSYVLLPGERLPITSIKNLERPSPTKMIMNWENIPLELRPAAERKKPFQNMQTTSNIGGPTLKLKRKNPVTMESIFKKLSKKEEKEEKHSKAGDLIKNKKTTDKRVGEDYEDLDEGITYYEQCFEDDEDYAVENGSDEEEEQVY